MLLASYHYGPLSQRVKYGGWAQSFATASWGVWFWRTHWYGSFNFLFSTSILQFFFKYRDHRALPVNSSMSRINSSSNAVARRYAKKTPTWNPRRRKILILLAITLVIIVIAVAVPVAVVTGHHSGSSSQATSSGSAGSGSKGATSGTSGSLITMDDGSTFMYANNFGGDWAADPTNPFLAGGKAQSWSPRVGAEEWVWGQDVARGVNLGWVLIFSSLRVNLMMIVPVDG